MWHGLRCCRKVVAVWFNTNEVSHWFLAMSVPTIFVTPKNIRLLGPIMAKSAPVSALLVILGLLLDSPGNSLQFLHQKWPLNGHIRPFGAISFHVRHRNQQENGALVPKWFQYLKRFSIGPKNNYVCPKESISANISIPNKVISSIPWHKLSMYIVYHESCKASDGLVKDVLARFSLQTTHVLSVNNILSIHGWSEI